MQEHPLNNILPCLFVYCPSNFIMLDKLFGKGRKKDPAQAPDIVFGRYSDNNKTMAKTNRWTDADNLFKEKQYPASLDAFFDYLTDDAMQNVNYSRNGDQGQFSFYQGSKIVRGKFDAAGLAAEVSLAKMAQPSVPVMRRLLEMNFSLYYSRFALDKERLCVRFDTSMDTSSPSKLYYGLKELATKADKQDDLLLQDFAALQTDDSDHVAAPSQQEKDVNYDFLQRWIQQTLDTISGLDADKFSGGIAYLLLALVYRIDYLLAPEGKILNELEKISGIYFKKDERQTIEKNRDMAEAFKNFKALPKADIQASFIRSRYTFAIVTPQAYKTISDSIHGSNANMFWYRDNNYPNIACQVTEYGLSYCQYSYSLPRVITELFHLFMMINYPDYFKALGFSEQYYEPATNKFDSNAIINKINEIENAWKDKFPKMDIKTTNLKFDNLVNFNFSYSTELEGLNMDSK
jgi:hypothetical protein